MIAFEKLTIDEKIRLICGQGVWHTADLNGKIPQLLLCDGPVGLRKVCYDEMTGREYDQKSGHIRPYKCWRILGISNALIKWAKRLQTIVWTQMSTLF